MRIEELSVKTREEDPITNGSEFSEFSRIKCFRNDDDSSISSTESLFESKLQNLFE